MKYLILGFALLLAACQTLDGLDPPSAKRHFVLDNDWIIVIPSKRGPEKPMVVYGLRAGQYTLIGENDKGFFYKGTGDSVFQMNGKLAEQYAKTGQVASFAERYAAMVAMAGGSGGLWLPKPGVNAKPLLFFESITKKSDAVNAGLIAGGPAGMTTGAGMAAGMIIGMGVMSVGNSLANRSLIYLHLKGQDEAVAAIRIDDEI